LIAQQYVRQYANLARVGEDVAQLEVVLTYVLQAVSVRGHGNRLAFKGGTALRKVVFGSTGRFSRDLDFVGLDGDLPLAEEALFDDLDNQSYGGIRFRASDVRYSTEGNFGCVVAFRHSYGAGEFELQVSHRGDIVVPPQPRSLMPQPYFSRLEFEPQAVVSLHPCEMLAEKVMACNRRRGGSGKDVYDLYLFAQQGFPNDLAVSLVCLKAWTDGKRFDPQEFVECIQVSAFSWVELDGLLAHNVPRDWEQVCQRVRQRYGVLKKPSDLDRQVLDDVQKHHSANAYEQLADLVRRNVE
jgi:predicted nucleotidyltransferase component of viral defense system